MDWCNIFPKKFAENQICTKTEHNPTSQHPMGTQIAPQCQSIDTGAQEQAPASALCIEIDAESKVYRSEK